MDALDKQIRQYVKNWVPIIGLEHWDIKISYKNDHDSNNLATAQTQQHYYELHVIFNRPKVKTLSNRELEKLVVHELCHAPLSSLGDGHGHKSDKLVHYLDEQATSNFALALLRAAGRKISDV